MAIVRRICRSRRMLSNRTAILTSILCLLYWISIMSFLNEPTNNTTSSSDRIKNRQVRPHQRLPSGRIPKIFHQTWDSDKVPGVFYGWIYSWLGLHPDWEYWFWTQEDIRKLLNVHYPEYLAVYANYSKSLMKFDMARYLIVHRYGGVYVDLDMEALQPMDGFVANQSCFLSEETYVHPFLYYLHMEKNVMTTIIGCRPGHPFLSLILENLKSASADHPNDEMKSTGPFFLDGIYRRYIHSKTPKLSPGNELFAAYPDLFLPTYDPQAQELVMQECVENFASLSPKLKKVCSDPIAQDFRNKPKNVSYTDHHWVHVALWSPERKTMDLVNIKEIVPKVKRGSDMVDLYM